MNLPTDGATALVYSRADALKLSSTGSRIERLLSFTPNATHEALTAGYQSVDAMAGYDEYRHAEAITQGELIKHRWLTAIGAQSQHDSPLVYTIGFAIDVFLHGFSRIDFGLSGDGPWFVPSAEKWRKIDDREAALRAFGFHILGHYGSFLGRFEMRLPPFPGLYRMLLRVMSRLGRPQEKEWLTSRSDHPLHLDRELFAIYPQSRQWYIGYAELGIKEYIRLGREAFRLLSGYPHIQIRLAPKQETQVAELYDEYIAQIPSGRLKAAFERFPEIKNIAVAAHCARKECEGLLPHIGVKNMLATEISDPITAALYQACGSLGMRRCIANHNAFSPQASERNRSSLGRQISHQYGEFQAEQMLFWNPPSLLAGRQTCSPAADRMAGLNIITTSEMDAEIPDSSTFTILYASNAMRFFSHADWIYESVNELAGSITCLLDECFESSQDDYIIRCKSRRFELDEKALRSVAPNSDRITIKFRNDNPFVEDLARADLLIAFRSTTVFEALYARKPVLLWGESGRFRDLDGRCEPPSGSDRSAVYVVYDRKRLPSMIDAIREAHHGKPLTDEELDGFLWSAETPPAAEWARKWPD